MLSAKYVSVDHVGNLRIAIIVPKVLIEIILYNIAVKIAFKRSVYQQFSQWKKGGKSPLPQEKEKNNYFNQ